MVVTLPLTILVPGEALPGARRNGSLFKHVMMRADDETIRILLHHLLPPVEGFAGDRAGRESPVTTSTYRRPAIVAITHH